MRYLKKFEYSKNDTTYKKGDYVKIIPSLLDKNVLDCFEILNIEESSGYYRSIKYNVEYYNLLVDNFLKIQIFKSHIDDYADENDIIEYETRKHINKYNL